MFSREGAAQIWARARIRRRAALAGRSRSCRCIAHGAPGRRGFALQPEQRINNGVAQAYWPKRTGAVFGAVAGRPTNTVRRQGIDGPGCRWHARAVGCRRRRDGRSTLCLACQSKKVLFAGDNFYKSWPNLYAIRGTGYRDVRAWVASLTSMIAKEPHYLVGGHTRPILGQRIGGGGVDQLPGRHRVDLRANNCGDEQGDDPGSTGGDRQAAAGTGGTGLFERVLR